MKLPKIDFGFQKNRPFPESRPTKQSVFSKLFERLNLTPKLGASIGFFNKVQNFWSSLKIGRNQTKDRQNEILEKMPSVNIKERPKAKSREAVEDLLLNPRDN